MRIVDSATMQEIDRRAQSEYHVAADLLMEAAGVRLWLSLRALAGLTHAKTRLCVVAGKGNNGGDALVIARHAHADGYDVDVVLSAPPAELGELAARHARSLQTMGLPRLVWADAQDSCREAISRANVVCDGLAGTGIKGALRAPLDAICRSINTSDAFVASIDVPSGVGDAWVEGHPAVRADATLTVGLPKLALYMPAARPLCGVIKTVPLFPRDLIDDPSIPGEVLDADDFTRVLAPLDESAYKTVRGVVAVFGGSRGFTGAPVLAATAALRVRAGLVTVHVDEDVYPIVASAVRSVMVRSTGRDPEDVRRVVSAAGATLIGPGWGQSDGRAELLRSIIQAAPRGVIDADGLNVLAASPQRLHDQWVLTPHPGELARLLGVSTSDVTGSFLDSALDLSVHTGAVVVAKSITTVIAEPDGRFAFVDGMNAALGTAGSGDVLAGAITALLASGMRARDAARAAVLAHQIAGRRLRARDGLFLAEDLPAELGRVIDDVGE